MTKPTSKERVRRAAERQHGHITGGQLAYLGIAPSTIHTWKQNGYLVEVLPKVYAVGHVAASREADLWAAILYAGPGAMLSHGTAAHWRGVINFAPAGIEVSTPRKIKSTAGVRVYGRRGIARAEWKRLPVTPIPNTLVDLAATSDIKVVRRALAVLDFRHELDVDAVEAICKPGRPGSRRLRQALQIHQPELAATNGTFEERFLEFCEHWELPTPRFNVPLHGILVDAYWPATRLAVELDGNDNHRTRAQLHRDMTSDLILRRHGITIRRYGWRQLGIQGREIRDEILAGLNRHDAAPRRDERSE
jgi:very-short-patch-repair endonuclease